MSINDLMYPDLTPLFVIIMSIITVILIIILYNSLKYKKHVKESTDASETESIKAKIIIKKSYYSLFNVLLFECENGYRWDFLIKDNNLFYSVFEGDEGILTHKGATFISFNRFQ